MSRAIWVAGLAFALAAGGALWSGEAERLSDACLSVSAPGPAGSETVRDLAARELGCRREPAIADLGMP
jgi:hypothetical protein